MKSISFDVVDATGNPVLRSAVHLHHVLLMNPARTSPFCANWSERFAGAGSERTPMSMPDPYAYMVGSNERWNALWHLMNTSDSHQQVFIQYTVGYQPGATAQNTRGVTPFFLDVTRLWQLRVRRARQRRPGQRPQLEPHLVGTLGRLPRDRRRPAPCRRHRRHHQRRGGRPRMQDGGPVRPPAPPRRAPSHAVRHTNTSAPANRSP